MKNVTYGSLFAGVGGFDLGLDQAGWECKFQVEWDKNCQKVLNRHWPDVPKYWDVTTVNGSELEPVDMIVFGSPCQDLSNAGKRAGLDGDRSSMFFEAVRIINEMRNRTNGEYPKWAIWENVTGALTSNKGADFAEVINQMANIGALAIEWHVLDAQWFGVPQRRRRVFLVSCWDSTAIERSGGQILPVPEDSRGDIKKSRKARKSTARASEISNGSPVLYGKTGYSKYSEGGVAISATDYKHPDQNFVLDTYVKVVRSGKRDENGNLPPEVWRSEGTCPTLNANDNTGESRSTVLVFQPAQEQQHNADKTPNVMIVDGTRIDDFRLYEDGIFPTLKHRMGTGGGQVPLVAIDTELEYSYDGYNNAINKETYRSLRTNSDSADHIAISDINQTLVLRRLTPVECERLMGFPDNHTKFADDGKIIADTNRYKMCGNAVASPVAEWIGRQILRLL